MKAKVINFLIYFNIVLVPFSTANYAHATLLTQVKYLLDAANHEKSVVVDSCALQCLGLAAELVVTPILPFGLFTIMDFICNSRFQKARATRMKAKSYNVAIKQLQRTKKLLEAIEKAFAHLNETTETTKFLTRKEQSLIRMVSLPDEDFSTAVKRLHQINLDGHQNLNNFSIEIGEHSYTTVCNSLCFQQQKTEFCNQ